MSGFPSIFAVILIISSIILIFVAYYAYRKRENPGGILLALLSIALAEWAFTASIEATVKTLPAKILWSKISYIGIVNIPLLLLLFSYEFTRRETVKKIWRFGPLFLFQLVILGLAFTNEHHHLIWTTFTPSSIPGSNTFIYGHGAWFWIMIAYIYILMLISSLLLVLAFFRARHVHRQQFFITIVALIPPWLVNTLYVFNIEPFFETDVTPAAFTLTGLIIAWSFFRLYYLDIMPLARDQVIEEMKDGVLVLDSSNRIVDVNPAAQKLVSLDANLIVGRDADSVLGNFIKDWNVNESNAEVYVENIGYLEWRVSLLNSTDGKNSQGRLIMVRDITDRKRAEEALNRLNASLEEQVAARTAEIKAEKELSDAILRSVNDGIMMASPDLRIRYVNPAFFTLTGYTATEVLGRHAIKIALGEGAGWIRQSIESYLEEGTQWQNEVVAYRKDGRAYDASLIAAPIRKADQQISGYVFTLRDVSQRKSLERVRYKFMENISHQFRTPVTVLNLYAHLMRHGDLSIENRRHLDTIKNQIDRLTLLIQDILEMADLDSGKAVSAWTDVYLPNLINSTLSDYSNRAKGAGLELGSKMLPEDLPTVKGDEKRLAQALGEVLENAILFTPSGGEVQIDIGIVEKEKSWVTISVIDSGPGIPIDEQEKVFERFFRGSLADSGNTIGTGLGLSIAQEIMQAHGGAYHVRERIQWVNIPTLVPAKLTE
ncbi:MAG: PAS domain S-box protein [Anaerolineales bacterium]|nr:PAS domain S-box protein [Anaerolineales bacterium]